MVMTQSVRITPQFIRLARDFFAVARIEESLR
jgi:hypothetical protein